MVSTIARSSLWRAVIPANLPGSREADGLPVGAGIAELETLAEVMVGGGIRNVGALVGVLGFGGAELVPERAPIDVAMVTLGAAGTFDGSAATLPEGNTAAPVVLALGNTGPTLGCAGTALLGLIGAEGWPTEADDSVLGFTPPSSGTAQLMS